MRGDEKRPVMPNSLRDLPQEPGQSPADAAVDVALEDSMPASDPPSFNAAVEIGTPSLSRQKDQEISIRNQHSRSRRTQ
jgi:hypothetical protein